IPQSKLTADLRAQYNLIYLGVRPAALDTLGWPIQWDGPAITFAGKQYPNAAIAFILPEGDRLSAVFAAAGGSESILSRIQPFHSGFAIPDYMIWSATNPTI